MPLTIWFWGFLFVATNLYQEREKPMKSLGQCAAMLAFCLLIAGCGGSGTKAKLVAPVTGTITIDGEPAADIMVQFVPATTDETFVAATSQALTNSEGKFVLVTTKNEPGAVAGPHRVTLSDTLEERPAQGERMTKPPRLHPKYASPGLKITVVAGEEIMIEASRNP